MLEKQYTKGTRPLDRFVLMAVLAAANLLSRSVLGAEDLPAHTDATSPSTPEPNHRDRARSLYQQGEIEYSFGRYDEAIALFREAYQLTSAPALLFDIAQAHRLNGECATALSVYQHFLRLDVESPHATEARGHITTLAARCPPLDTRPLMVAKPQETQPSTLVGPIPVDLRLRDPIVAHPARNYKELSRMLLAGGLVTGAGTGLLYWWNDSRHDRWNAEDRTLQAGPGTRDSATDWIARQDRNDVLLRSIWHVDTMVGILTALALGCVLGSTTLAILSDPDVAPASGAQEVPNSSQNSAR